jgi:hypothetical protein
MADEPNIIPMIRIARWLAIGLLICFAVALYFRNGTRLPPMTEAGPVGVPADSAP